MRPVLTYLSVVIAGLMVGVGVGGAILALLVLLGVQL